LALEIGKMSTAFVTHQTMPEFSLWRKTQGGQVPLSFDWEITARCNCNCRHCYINLPANDTAARSRELSLPEIRRIAGEASALGALWCLLSGGEPLLRKDFEEIYLVLKRQGFLVSVFTNACLLTPRHIELFRQYPPRDLEVTAYGITKATYERVTRTPGSYEAFRRGLDLLLENGIPVRLKAMALRSNVHELSAVAQFCRQHTLDFYRFDPFLQLRYDRNAQRNDEISSERLSPEEVVAIEQADAERHQALQNTCEKLILTEAPQRAPNHLFVCGAGRGGFCISYDGYFKLCSALCHPECVFDLRQGTLKQAWFQFVDQVRSRRSTKPEFIEHCWACPIIPLCLWCPAHAHLETGELDGFVGLFCKIAHARAEALRGIPAATSVTAKNTAPSK
jgi:radical SAM protein with 4Fe4S-binding SPASM domain